jgi:hypothetical protein
MNTRKGVTEQAALAAIDGGLPHPTTAHDPFPVR